jgi:hypothetical protein
MIKGLGTPNFVNTTVSTSTEPEAETTRPPQAAGGISSFNDSFEQANAAADYITFVQQQSTDAGVSQPDPAIASDKVDASTIFDFVPPEPPKPNPQPAPVDDGLGKTLEDLAEKKILETYQQKTTKDYGPDPKRVSESSKYGDQALPENLSNLGSGGGTTLGELKGSWNAAEFGILNERTEGELGEAWAKGSTKVIALDGGLYYKFGVDPEKKTVSVGVGANGSVEVIGAHYEIGYSTPDVEIGNSKVDVDGKVNGDAWVGAKGNVGVGITLGKENKANAEAGGFAGGKASLSGDVGVGDAANANGNITGWAGIGAKAGAEVGFNDGEFTLKAGFGLALGLGLEWDLGLKIDYGRVARLGLDGMREIGLDEEADWISDRADDALQFAGDAAHWAGNTAEDAAKETAKAVEEAMKAAQKALADAMGWTIGAGEDPSSAIDDIIETGEDLIEGAGEFVEDAVDFIEDIW